MAVASTSCIERIARVLAGADHSSNADGIEASASAAVDETWPAYRNQAAAVLRTLREPTAVMAQAGDADVWERMVLAALDEPG